MRMRMALIVAAALLPVNMVRLYGARREFGRYATPRAAIGDAGRYRDGTLPDHMTAALIRSGYEEEVMLGICCIAVASMLVAVQQMLDSARQRRRLMRERCLFLRRMEGLE